MATRQFLIVTVALVAVCGTPTAPCACEPERTHLIVYGAVQTSAGAAVADAKVFVIATAAGTPVPDPVLGAGEGAVTDAQGKYRVRVLSGLSPTAPAAVHVAVVHAPADTVRSDATGASLRSERDPADSLELNVVVP